MQLKGQVALVTGAGRGIGKAIALRFAREGADVAVLDLNGEWAQATGEEIKMLGRRTVTKTVDVSDCEHAQTAVHEAAAALGKLDVIVNNAGIGKAQHFLKITKENWERHLQIHLSGTFYCAQAAAQEMVKHKYGRIINIASIAGLIGPIDLAPYGAAKAGIIGLTRAAALDRATKSGTGARGPAASLRRRRAVPASADRRSGAVDCGRPATGTSRAH